MAKVEKAQLERKAIATEYDTEMAHMKERQQLQEDRRLKRDLLSERLANAEHRRSLREKKTAAKKKDWEHERRSQLQTELEFASRVVSGEVGRLPPRSTLSGKGKSTMTQQQQQSPSPRKPRAALKTETKSGPR